MRPVHVAVYLALGQGQVLVNELCGGVLHRRDDHVRAMLPLTRLEKIPARCVGVVFVVCFLRSILALFVFWKRRRSRWARAFWFVLFRKGWWNFFFFSSAPSVCSGAPLHQKIQQHPETPTMMEIGQSNKRQTNMITTLASLRGRKRQNSLFSSSSSSSFSSGEVLRVVATALSSAPADGERDDYEDEGDAEASASAPGRPQEARAPIAARAAGAGPGGTQAYVEQQLSPRTHLHGPTTSLKSVAKTEAPRGKHARARRHSRFNFCSCRRWDTGGPSSHTQEPDPEFSVASRVFIS